MVYQFDCRDIDVCVALIKGRLAREHDYVEDRYEDDEPLLLDDPENVWNVILMDETQMFWAYIVETVKT
jgi:hypothetical protein